MAYEHHILPFSFPANADLSANQFRAVSLNTSGKLVLANATTTVIGILQDTPVADEAGNVCILGISNAVTDGSTTAIAVGDPLSSDANGKLIKNTTDNAPTAATALEASTTDGAIISVLVQPARRY